MHYRFQKLEHFCPTDLLKEKNEERNLEKMEKPRCKKLSPTLRKSQGLLYFFVTLNLMQ